MPFVAHLSALSMCHSVLELRFRNATLAKVCDGWVRRADKKLPGHAEPPAFSVAFHLTRPMLGFIFLVIGFSRDLGIMFISSGIDCGPCVKQNISHPWSWMCPLEVVEYAQHFANSSYGQLFLTIYSIFHTGALIRPLQIKSDLNDRRYENDGRA
jgi:hypothetical protein